MTYRLDYRGFSADSWLEQLKLLFIPFNIWVVGMLIVSGLIVFTDIGRDGPPKLSQTHHYLSEPDTVKCRRASWQGNGTHELVIKQLDQRFYVTNLSQRSCDKLLEDVDSWINFDPTEPDVPLSLWHAGFVVYQLGEQGNILNYELQYARLKMNFHQDEEHTVNILLIIWVVFGFFRKIVYRSDF